MILVEKMFETYFVYMNTICNVNSVFGSVKETTLIKQMPCIFSKKQIVITNVRSALRPSVRLSVCPFRSGPIVQNERSLKLQIFCNRLIYFVQNGPRSRSHETVEISNWRLSLIRTAVYSVTVAFSQRSSTTNLL